MTGSAINGVGVAVDNQEIDAIFKTVRTSVGGRNVVVLGVFGIRIKDWHVTPF